MTAKEFTSGAKRLPPDVRTQNSGFARAVGAFMPKVTARVFEKYGFHSAEIMTSWPTIVGAETARLARPEAIKWPRGASAGDADESRSSGATLIVACSPAFALEVSYRTQDIIDRINRYFGYRAIARLKVRQEPTVRAVCEPVTPEPRLLSVPKPTAGDLAGALATLSERISVRKRT